VPSIATEISLWEKDVDIRIKKPSMEEEAILGLALKSSSGGEGDGFAAVIPTHHDLQPKEA
jgi:hypothetical protein